MKRWGVCDPCRSGRHRMRALEAAGEEGKASLSVITFWSRTRRSGAMNHCW